MTQEKQNDVNYERVREYAKDLIDVLEGISETNVFVGNYQTVRIMTEYDYKTIKDFAERIIDETDC